MRRLLPVAAALSLVLGLADCGPQSDNASGSGGVGGAAGSGTGGTGVDASPDATAPAVPSCLQALFAQCPAQGSCTAELDDAGIASKFCYASGAQTSSSTQNPCGASNDLQKPTITDLTVRRADGSLCYSIEYSCSCGQFCESSAISWRNAAGDVVATGSTGSSGAHVECVGTAEACSGDYTDCGTSEPDINGCMPGTCP